MMIRTSIYKKLTKLLKFEKSLVIFDIETTGLNISSDKIVELAYVKVWPNGRVKKDDMLLNPEMKITLEASAVHGIRSQDVKDKPAFRVKSQELWDVFNGCYYSGFNIINFDLPILRREFIRVGMDFEYVTSDIIDSREIFLKMVPRTLSSSYEYYCKRKLNEWHTALNDTEATAEILVRQLEKYKEIRDWEFINKLHQTEEEAMDSTRKFYWLHGTAYFAFSKYRDKSLKQIARNDPKFLEWILAADFNDDVKSVVRMALEGKEQENKENNKK